MADDTRDTAIRALTKIEEHTATCDKRYAESNQRMEKLFSYIKEAHEKTSSDIDELKTAFAEQRGAGKMAKAMMGAIAGVSGFIGGLGGHLAIK